MIPRPALSVRCFDALAGTIDADTIAKYRANYLLYVAPTLGSRAVASIRVSEVKKLRSDLSQVISTRTKRPLSAGTIRHAMNVLRMILDTAVENEALATNPAAVKMPNLWRVRDFQESKPYTRLTVQDIAAAAEYIAAEHTYVTTRSNGRRMTHTKPASPVYALAVLFSAFTGVRRGELQGLEIADLALSDIAGTSGAVTVARAKLAPTFAPRPLKTENAYRTIPLDSWLADDIRTYLADTHQDAGNRSAPLFPGRLTLRAGQVQGRNTRDRGDLFDWTRPIDEAMVYKRYWLPALSALDLPHSRWHDLRHAFAVASLAGEHYRDVSRWLGHSKISTTLDIYASVLPSEDTAKAAPLARPVAARKADRETVVPLKPRMSG